MASQVTTATPAIPVAI
ncbi:Protein of unknown function [Propionibacterium freudenreichii]|nr:Protein of unknown function [Propionibacterium freudenreichii]CEG90510.1 Protein of unknown function [Propionibacterium freudenreichii]CEG93935.1 Protein of unknown function [Propionibacterium freudenreichii]CEG98927.1 Protein of unknown function [Propionibacterium freudenreichii]CEH02825.1 Protein of unknown function [Propionibacterium freudenreichii]